MKWANPQHGDTRVRKGFLWFPRTIGRETRWLEKAVWEEHFWTTPDHDRVWLNVRWLTEEGQMIREKG